MGENSETWRFGRVRSRTFAIKQRDAMLKIWYYNVRVAPWRGTAYGVLQAANTYNQHEAAVRGTPGQSAP